MTIVAPGVGSEVTANDLITRAMRLSGAIGKGETPDDDEAQDGLVALNAMLDNWQIQRLFVYAVITEAFTWAANEQSQTVGEGGDFDTDLPTRIADDCSFTVNGTDYRVALKDVDAWSTIPDKTTSSSFGWWMYVEYGAALVTLNAYPIPNTAVQFNLRSWKRLQFFQALTDTIALPPGASRALAFSLAEEFGGPEFGLALPPGVVAIARSARRALRKVNATSPIMSTEVGLMTRRRSSYIRSDWP